MSDKPSYADLGLTPKLGQHPSYPSHPYEPPKPTPRKPVKINIFPAKKPANQSRPPSTKPAAPQKPCRTFHGFMDLPLEVRNIIYQYAFMSKTEVIGSRYLRLRGDQDVYDYDKLWREDRRNQRAPMAGGLLRANHKIFHEALEYLYRSQNTIIITSSAMFWRFLALPENLPICFRKNCKPSPMRPLIQKGIWYPKELDFAFPSSDDMERMIEYLPELYIQPDPINNPQVKIGVEFRHMTIDISTPFPSLSNFEGALSSSRFKIIESFTIRGWDFQRKLRIWLKSEDCVETIKQIGLHNTPSAIEELPLNMRGERRPWTVTWISKSIPAPTAFTGPQPALPAEGAVVEDQDVGFSTGLLPRGQLNISYQLLKSSDISDHELDLASTFPEVEVKRITRERPQMGPRVLGE